MAMPGGQVYLWVAPTVLRGYSSYGASSKTFPIGLGWDVQHGERLIYSKDVNLKEAKGYTQIGAGGKVCPHNNFPRRDLPAVGNTLVVDENRRRFAPCPIA